MLDKLPQRAPSSQLSGSLFLQLTVDQLGVCIPLYNGNQVCKSTPSGILLSQTVSSLWQYTSVFCAWQLRNHGRGHLRWPRLVREGKRGRFRTVRSRGVMLVGGDGGLVEARNPLFWNITRSSALCFNCTCV